MTKPRATRDPASAAPMRSGLSDAHCRAIVESATDDAFIAMDRERRILGWSAGAEAVIGWSEAEVLGKSADLIFTPADRAAGTPEAEMQAALDKGRCRDERWHLRRDGGRFWAVGELIGLADPAAGFVKVLRDRTERKQAEERLRESEDHFRHTVELNPQVPWTCDPHGNITSTRVVGST